MKRIANYFMAASFAVMILASCGKDNTGAADDGDTTKINGHEYVDLGLSVKWATCNVGADSPEEYGDYFALGRRSRRMNILLRTVSLTIRNSLIFQAILNMMQPVRTGAAHGGFRLNRN